mmetsp:Transcript_66024/g.162527  ORF Transcript_66024/g.162527 Transcript_66024/m.162527 type:complete len:270 (+) Transcript_66024:497-1306(+)
MRRSDEMIKRQEQTSTARPRTKRPNRAKGSTGTATCPKPKRKSDAKMEWGVPVGWSDETDGRGVLMREQTATINQAKKTRKANGWRRWGKEARRYTVKIRREEQLGRKQVGCSNMKTRGGNHMRDPIEEGRRDSNRKHECGNQMSKKTNLRGVSATVSLTDRLAACLPASLCATGNDAARLELNLHGAFATVRLNTRPAACLPPSFCATGNNAALLGTSQRCRDLWSRRETCPHPRLGMGGSRRERAALVSTDPSARLRAHDASTSTMW